MNRKVLLAGGLLFCGTVWGCASGETTDSAEESGTGNSNRMTCLVGGRKLTGAADEVGVGSFGTWADSVNLALSLNITRNGERVAVSTGLMNLPAREGSYSLPGLRGFHNGSYERRNSSDELIREYTGPNYWLFYAQQAQDPATQLQITLSEVEKFPTELPDMVRMKLKGNFQFHTAYVPYVDGSPSQPCLAEAMTRSLKGGPRFPQYNARICGAEELEVRGEFEVTQDLLKLGK